MHVEIGEHNTPDTGAGTVYVDCVARDGVDFVASWGVDRLPFDSASVDSLFASHVIEHVPWFMIDKALAEAFRVLKPGGSISLWAPDFAAIVEGYLAKAIPDGDPWRRFNKGGDFMRWVNGRLFAYFNDDEGPENLHKSAHDFPSLADSLVRARFVNPSRLKRTEGYAPHGSAEFGVIAYVPT